MNSHAAASAVADEGEQSYQARRPLVTPLLIGVCGVVFVAMLASGVSLTEPNSLQLIRWGADFGPYTLGGQWWRLLTSMFLHIGIVHLLVNMWCLWNLGALAEMVFGRRMFATLYLITGLAGAITSVAWNPLGVSAGASGAIFGVAGALIAYLYLAHLPFDRQAIRSTLTSLLIFAGFNLALGFRHTTTQTVLGPRHTGVDNAAHLGGLISGLLIGAVLAWLAGRNQPRGDARRRAVLAVSTVALMVACGLVARSRGYVVHLERGRVALDSGQADTAVAEFTRAVERKPALVAPHFLLGEALLRKRKYSEAEAEYRRALSLDANNGQARYQLGLVLLLQNRLPEAAEVFADLGKREPRNWAGYFGLGTVARASGNLRAAYGLFQRAAQLDSSRPQIFAEMGLVALQLQAYDQAIGAFQRLTQLEPRNPQGYQALAEAYRAKGMYPEAEAAFEKAASLMLKKP